MIWVYAIADAYRVATKSEVEPALDHKVRLSVNRMMTVGFRADPSRPGFYDDWNVSIMGQAAPRLSVGVSDISVKLGGAEGPQVWQFGARVDYRVFDRGRLWINLGLGSILQVAVGQGTRGLDPGARRPRLARHRPRASADRDRRDHGAVPALPRLAARGRARRVAEGG